MAAALRLSWLSGLLIPALAGAQAAPPADGQVLRETLSGEFALQEGRLKEAAGHYAAAARQTGDAGLAERGTRIALLADDLPDAVAALSVWKQAAPESLAQRAAGLTIALRQADANAALVQARGLLADPDSRGWKHVLMALSMGGRDPRTSSEVLGRLIDTHALPERLDVWLAYAGLAQHLQRRDLAQALISQSEQRWPEDPRVQVLKASQQIEAGEFDAARKSLAALAARAKTDEQRLAVAAEYESLGDFHAAERLLAANVQTTQVVALRAAMLDKAHDTAGLEALYRQRRAQPRSADPAELMLLGTLAETLNHDQDALHWYQEVGNDKARLRQANVRFRTGDTRAAFQMLSVLQTDPRVEDSVQRDAYLLDAELHQKQKDDKGEMAALDLGLAAREDDSALLYSRALAWERRDDIPRSEADLRRILVTEPDNTAALNALGYTLADRTNRFDEALQLINRARAASPGDGAILDSYGWVLFRMGRAAEALPWLERAFVLQKDAEIAAHLSEVLLRLGRRDEALRYLAEGRRIDASNRAVQHMQETLGLK